jgi:hypothetical protein
VLDVRERVTQRPANHARERRVALTPRRVVLDQRDVPVERPQLTDRHPRERLIRRPLWLALLTCHTPVSSHTASRACPKPTADLPAGTSTSENAS